MKRGCDSETDAGATDRLFSRGRCDTTSVLRLRRPSHAELGALANGVRSEPFTYSAVGATSEGVWPTGYRHEQLSVDIGDASVFAGAADDMRQWKPQLGSGLALAATAELDEGTTVAMAAPVIGAWVLATCRVVYVEDEPGRFAWAYGTLPIHPEEGEERFEVAIDGDRTLFRIGVFSRPHTWLSRAAAPLARRLQARATQRYVEAMRPLR